MAVLGHLCLVTVGIAWWLLNLGTTPPYGDTTQYFQLADSLRVDQYRTLFYPLLLRGLTGIAGLLNARVELLVYMLQTAAALLSIAYLGRALWDVTAATTAFAFLARTAPTTRRVVIGGLAVVLFTEPLVNHFALSVVTDSLAASFTVAGVAALVRIAVLGDPRWRHATLAWLAIGAAGFMRAEKVWVFVLVLAATLVILAARARRDAYLGSHRARRRVVAILATLLIVPGAAVVAVNRATQTADHGWPPVTVSARVFVRTAWPRLADIRPLLSAETQAIVSAPDAERFDRQYNEYLSLVPRLRRSGGGTDRLVNEISLVALRYRGADIALATAGDALRNTAPMIAYPIDIIVGARTASSWTDSRMGTAHRLLTTVYLWLATALLMVLQIPLLIAVFFRGWKRDPRVAFAAALTVGTAVVNGVLYALGNGLQNVRYALPAYLLVYVVILWAGAAVLASLWRTPTEPAELPAVGASC